MRENDDSSTGAGERLPPLQGLRIIDASRVLAGPFCGATLADLGADVIRVEHPTQIDEVRSWSPVVDGTAAAFVAVNHSKRSIAIDISTDEGRDIFLRLIGPVDVLIENYRPGTLERYRLGREVMKAANPRLIHCCVRAFPAGVRGEELPGYEASIQAYSGIMSITGEQDGPPVRCGPSVVDLGTGLVSTIAILAALRERDRTGLGSYVEPALLRTATNFMNFQVAALSLGGVAPQRLGSGHASLIPYGNFPTATGPILLAASNDRLWGRLCDVLGLRNSDGTVPYPSLEIRVAQRDTVNALVGGKMLAWERQALLDAFTAAGIPAAPVQTLEEYMSDDSLETAGVIERVELGPGRDVGIPGRLFGGDWERPARRRPPGVGEHGEDILRGLGIDADEYQRLKRSGIVH